MGLYLMRNIYFKWLNPFRVRARGEIHFPRISYGAIQVEPLRGLNERKYNSLLISFVESKSRRD